MQNEHWLQMLDELDFNFKKNSTLLHRVCSFKNKRVKQINPPCASSNSKSRHAKLILFLKNQTKQ
jgi:hypothetical protein